MASLPDTVPSKIGAKSPYLHVSDGLVRDWYFPILLFLAPIQSILLLPVQGTTPAFMLVLAAPLLLLGNDRRYFKLLGFLFLFISLYVVYMAVSLSGYLIDTPDLSNLTVIREIYVYGLLRQSHVTQGIYLMAALMFFFIMTQYYQESFIKWAFFGIFFLVAYGFYEFIFYAIFHENVDFLSNRNFGDLNSVAEGRGQGDYATGSAIQPSNLFGAGFMRLKSLVGEPSMYALTVTPFAVYAYGRKWWLIFFILFLSLFLSTSTTAVIGLLFGIAFIEISQRKEFVLYIGAFIFVSSLLYATFDPIQNALNTLLFEKMETVSGNERLTSFVDHSSVIIGSNIVRFAFGLGFGTVRSLDMMSNLLANIGVVGFLGFSAIVLYPSFRLKHQGDTVAIIAAVISIYLMQITTVPEYAYLPPWFIVALSYVRLRQQRLGQVAY
ncbi:hypothetical protein [Sphingomonas yabuuchiae]|uniref:hypothetical protein n=1 Tax=Sphingomonas yabuuchiae TaxID=172044 RepID=UPI000B2C1B66|nr:hypothetical protein [Sphingomonas yabuuchiae]